MENNATKGAAIALAADKTAEDAVNAVRERYADKIRSAKGWAGNATVNFVDANGKKTRTLIVKSVTGGFDVYECIGHVPVSYEPSVGKLKPAGK